MTRLARLVKAGRLDDARALVAKEEQQKRDARARKRDRTARAAGPTKAEQKRTKEDRLARLAEIRVALHVEAHGDCAVCRLSLPFVRMHAHHILSGPERQSEERQETMAPTHERCHDWLHGKNAKLDQRDALLRLLTWCEETGREAAAESTRRRIAKIEETRGARPAAGESRND